MQDNWRIKLVGNIQAAAVEQVEKHGNADKLWVLQLNTGDDDLVQVVTGAGNLQPGDLVPYLAPGHVVPGWLFNDLNYVELETRSLRGERSAGMVLSAAEIGIGPDDDEIMVLNDVDNQHIGHSVTEVMTAEQLQKILEIDNELLRRYELVISVTEDGGELVGADQLCELLKQPRQLYTYDGFEPSGQMHIAQGIIRAINVNKMIEAGFVFRMWVADWFGFLNNKMGGDMEKIRVVGEYFIEMWKAVGMNLDGVEFMWTSEVIDRPDYWEAVMRIARSTTLNRILRTTEIMGRDESDNLSAAQIIYPCMQIADIFEVMQADVTQLGLDQRKVNMLARQVGPELGYWKPVVLSHGMLAGLGKPISDDMPAADRAIKAKMSKSKPDTAIFMTDSRKDIERKLRKAYAAPGEVEGNPVLAYAKQIIFAAKYLEGREKWLSDGFIVERSPENGGKVVFDTYQQLEDAYAQKQLHPLDLKQAMVGYLDQLLEPVRKHFEQDDRAAQLLKQVRSFKVTR